MKRIKDKCEKNYLHALAILDFFPVRGYFPERKTSVSQRKMAQISRNKRGNSMDFARNLRGECNEHNPVLLEHKREGYKRHADCTVHGNENFI